ncbi:MAG: tyrosinase family protein [Saprospiraceae bacterium]|nr:tyrosinase family protein [Saprospiraceae bacterium]
MLIEEINIRKSVYDLSKKEIYNLRVAFERLYTTPSENNESIMMYQEKASILISDGHYQRNDMLFLPWARAYFADFEQALQNVFPDAKPSIALPYWDYTSKKAIARGIPSLLADEYYETVEKNEKGKKHKVIKKNPLHHATYTLPLQTFREEKKNTVLLRAARKCAKTALRSKDFVTFGTSIYLADIQSHIYIGGSSGNTNTTSFDPIFWFTHCQLDHFWFKWQQGAFGNLGIPDSVLNASLKPFSNPNAYSPMKTKDVLDTINLGYIYLDE